MTAEDLTVAGRRFRSRSDYEAALRDQRKIERIKAEKDLDDPVKIYELFRVLKSGAYRFETIVGTDFDDEIYEKTEELRKKGITVENAASFERTKEKKDVAGRTGHLNRKQSVKNRQKTPKES